MVLKVIVQPTLPPQSTFNVNFESVSITIISKGGKLKRNNVLEIYFISSRNACDSWPSDVPSACKCAHFAHELEHHLIGERKFDLQCSTFPKQISLYS